jgi:OOP family OmpA-OmpF porin
MTIRSIAITLSLLLSTGYVFAQTATATTNDETGNKVIAAGTVPDEASRAAILGKLRDVYGASAVVDRLEVGGVVPPPNWSEHMAKIVSANLKQVHKGQLQINGTQISLKGNVANEAQRQQVVSDMATALNPTYTIDNGLLVASAAPAQTLLDTTLSNRVVEFESGSATLTPAGNAILDEMFAAIKQIGNSKIQVIGHTDSVGNRQANIALSRARANSVRAYLVGKGIPEGVLSSVGAGPDHPLATNNTQEGRSKNRRIEFHLVN